MKFIFAIAIKDLVRSFRSLFAVGMMFVAPLLITGLIYFAFGGIGQGQLPQISELRVVVVNLDRSPLPNVALGQLLVDFLASDQMPDWMVVTSAADEAAARTAITGRTAGAAVIIPVNFTQAVIESGQNATVQMLQDPTLTIGPAVLKEILARFTDGISATSIARNTITGQVTLDAAAVQALMTGFSQFTQQLNQGLQSGESRYLTLQSTQAAPLANQMKDMMALIMAGQLIFFAFYTGAYTSESIIREQEEGTLARLFTTAVPRSTILAGKFAGVFVMVIVQAVVLLVISGLVFNIHWGNALGVALIMVCLAVAASGFGLMVMGLVKNTKQSGAVLGGFLTLTGMGGGLFTVGTTMPAAFETVTLFLPQGWALRSMRLLLADRPPVELLFPALVLLAFGAVLFAAGVVLFRRRFA